MPAQAIKRLSIKHAQQLHLSLQLQFPDFVEEKRASIGQLEQARLGCVGAAERALFVAEQFALHQVFRKGGAVDVDPRTAAAMGRLMDGPRDQFLAGPGLASNQHRFGVAGDAIDQSHELVHDRAGQNEFGTVNLARDNAARLSQPYADVSSLFPPLQAQPQPRSPPASTQRREAAWLRIPPRNWRRSWAARIAESDNPPDSVVLQDRLPQLVPVFSRDFAA